MTSTSVGRSLLLVVCLSACVAAEPRADELGLELAARFNSLLDARDFESAERVLCADVAIHLAGEDFTRSDFMEYAHGAYQAFVDFRHEIEDLFAVGDRVALRATVRATHLATGTQVSFGQISLYRVAAGCIAEWWEEHDQYRLMQQLEAGTSG